MSNRLPKRELNTTDGLKLLLPKEVCSWMDSSALRRCILSDNYITSKVTPSGRYVYFVYMYEIVVFNTFCGTKKEFPTAMELITFIPIDDLSGYIIQLESGKLYAREVAFDFALEALDEKSKTLLIHGCSKFPEQESISYLEHSSQLSILYYDLSLAMNFRTFNISSWDEACPIVEQFGNTEYNRFPFLHNGYAYAFRQYRVTTIREAATRFGKICEVDPKVASTIPVQPIEQPAIDAQQLQVPIQMIAARQRNLRNGIGAAIQQQQNVFNFNAQVALAMNVAMPPRPDRARPRREPILPRYRIVSLVNDLTCVGIPEAIGKLENSMEKFDFQWRGDRLFLLWTIGIRKDYIEDRNRNLNYNYFDFELFDGGFINFFAIFDISNLTWYPIRINGLNPYSDSPLSMNITEDMFLTLFKSQMTMPFRWSRLRLFPSAYHSKTSILEIESKDAKKATVYRIPISEPDSLINITQSLFNRLYPNWTSLNHNELQERYGRCISVDHKFHNDNNALLEIYVYDIRNLARKKTRGK